MVLVLQEVIEMHHFQLRNNLLKSRFSQFFSRGKLMIDWSRGASR